MIKLAIKMLIQNAQINIGLNNISINSSKNILLLKSASTSKSKKEEKRSSSAVITYFTLKTPKLFEWHVNCKIGRSFRGYVLQR